MDIPTLIFVAFLCVVAFFLTMNVRRDFIVKERQRREQQRKGSPPSPQTLTHTPTASERLEPKSKQLRSKVNRP